MRENRCIFCHHPIQEDRHVCTVCEKAEAIPNPYYDSAIPQMGIPEEFFSHLPWYVRAASYIIDKWLSLQDKAK